MEGELSTLGAEGLRRFQLLRNDVIGAVTERFYAEHGGAYEQFGARGQEACHEDLTFHLEFLQPVLEFGLLQPMVDYLRWLASVLAAHVALSLDLLGEFFAERMAAADGAVVTAALRAARVQFQQAEAAPVAPASSFEPWPEVAAFEMALLAGHQRDALAVMDRCIDGGRSLVEVELNVIRPSLYDIGEKWQANLVTVAQEHMATAIVESVMTVGLLRSPPPAMNGKRALLACVQGSIHAIGLRMVSDAFQLSGLEVQYLGANVPTVALIQHAVVRQPDFVGLSVSFAHQLRTVKDIVAQLETQLGSSRPAVIVGGLAVNRFNRLAGMVGADASCADAPDAVLSVNRIVRCHASRPN